MISIIKVEGMSCNHCKNSIESALKEQNGIDTAEVSLAEKTVTVNYDSEVVSLKEIEEIIEDRGFEVIYS